MKKIAITIVIIIAIVLSSCGISKGLHSNNHFTNLKTKYIINKEHNKTVVY